MIKERCKVQGAGENRTQDARCRLFDFLALAYTPALTLFLKRD